LGFAVMLGIVIISWGSSGAFAGRASCEGAAVSAVNVNNTSKACFKEGMLSVIVENTGSTEVSGLLVDIIGSKGVQQQPAAKQLSVAEMENILIPFDAESVGTIQKIKIVPSVMFRESTLCPVKGFEAEKIEACTG
jgi:hypothetical protein